MMMLLLRKNPMVSVFRHFSKSSYLSHSCALGVSWYNVCTAAACCAQPCCAPDVLQVDVEQVLQLMHIAAAAAAAALSTLLLLHSLNAPDVLQVNVEQVLQAWPLHLHHHALPSLQPRQVHLQPETIHKYAQCKWTK
jgi:hypothetical protein